MATTRTASRCLLGLRRGMTQNRCTPIARPHALQSRPISHRAAPSPSVICTFAPPSTSNSRRSAQRQSRAPLRSSPSPAVRNFSTTRAAAHGDWSPPKAGEELYVTFVDKEGDEHKIAVSKGDNLLDVAQANDIEMEGACGGSCACSTCHVIVEDEAMYDKIPEPDDDENDMLDLAFGLTETSRLGCQVIMNEELNGLRVKLPSMTRNMQASDFTKK